MSELENIIIHRGSYSYKYPENSIPAFRESISKNKAIELDVHILKDDTVVVFHDANLKRMCGIDKKIKDYTYQELLKCKLNNTIYTIPTLQNVLDLVGGYVTLDIELKYDVTDHRLENEVINILKNYKGKYFLKSFEPRIVRYLKKLRRKNKMCFKIGLLISDSKYLLPFITYSNPDFISFSYKNLNNLIFRFFSKIKPTLLYTIKSKADYESIKDYNGGYIVENYDGIFK